MWKLAEDTLDREDLDALAAWLRTSPRLTQAEQVRAFERAWSSWLGVADSVMVASGSAANFALVLAVHQRLASSKLRMGASAVTWPTNVSPSLILGHELTLFDIDQRTLGIAEEPVCRAMSAGELDVLFVTHLLGLNALTPRIVETAERCGVLLLEDCCEAHGARHGAGKVGSVGLASTFSFYFGHHMSTIEGGMVSTNDLELADHLRVIRSHGLARESTRFAAHAAAHPNVDPRFLFLHAGMNFRSTELNAFLGLRQLERLDARIAQRNANMRLHLECLPPTLWRDFETTGMSSFALPLIANDAETATKTRAVVDVLGIESRPVVAGNLRRQPFLQAAPIRTVPAGLPIADSLHSAGLYVGNGSHVTASMVETLAREVTRALERH